MSSAYVLKLPVSDTVTIEITYAFEFFLSFYWDLERNGLSQAEFCPRNTMISSLSHTSVQNRLQPGLIMTLPGS